jgi:hypothetical protein
VYITNALIYSHQSYTGDDWAIGYGLKKMFFNRSVVPGMTESRFIGYGLDVSHINSEKGEVVKDVSLVTRLKFMAGMRITSKSNGFNWFVSTSLNGFWNKNGNSIAPKFLSSSTKLRNTNLEYWPGFAVGLILH